MLSTDWLLGPRKHPPLRVFLVEDDRDLRRMLATALRNDGHFVIEARDGAGLMADLGHVFAAGEPDDTLSVIVADVRARGQDGRSLLGSLRELHALPWFPPLVLITAFGDHPHHEEARALGAHAVLARPFDLQLFRAKVGSVRQLGGGFVALASGSAVS
jgi:two-component system nitrogen regulation response regulator GlnG